MKTPRSFARRVSLLAGCAALVLIAGGCTTTTTTHASTDLRPVSKNGSPSAMSELRIAQSALESGNMDMATTLYEKILQNNPNSVEALTGLGNALYTVGDFTRAGVYYNKASAIDKSAPAPLIGAARVAIRQRRFDDAIATYQRVLAESPDDPLAAAGLGAALDLQGKHDEAQTVLHEALKRNPGDTSLSINLGLSLVMSGKPRDGANVLLDVTRFPAAPPQARQDLALAYGLLGNDDAAAEILGRDLPKSTVQDNLRFYEIQRQRMGMSDASVTSVSAR
ncbi:MULTISPECIES: lipopolysaccharide assembly protein LapB [unclassified Caballeronia]|uniref:tetratricopeptide repeat protein n=1 Tax=unclassified Caballeronia TaxID=2646786 RepID=UPI00158A07F4|nr:MULTISPECIES: tetratricopeptide repeat protein [unclassified Caballeronia]QSN62999.1 tetratricopeptide repeat protein [Caballeronia sp. M1242]